MYQHSYTVEGSQCHDCKFAQREWILTTRKDCYCNKIHDTTVIDSCSINSEYFYSIDKSPCPNYQKGDFSLRELPKDLYAI